MKNKVALITFARFPSEMAYGVHLIQIANSFHENNYGVNIYYPRTYNSKTIYTNPKDYYGVTNDIKFIEVNNISPAPRCSTSFAQSNNLISVGIVPPAK